MTEINPKREVIIINKNEYWSSFVIYLPVIRRINKPLSQVGINFPDRKSHIVMVKRSLVGSR